MAGSTNSINTRNATAQKRFDFGGVALDTAWTTALLGTGMSVSVANSLLSIASGTTANAQTVLKYTEPVTLKVLARFIARTTQRIANHEVFFELVNEAGGTAAYWRLDGTSPTLAKYGSRNRSTANTEVAVTVPATTSFVNFEIRAEAEQVQFTGRASNTDAAQSFSGLFDRLILEPDESYYLQIRVVNGSTPPASSTTLEVDAVLMEDLQTLAVEVLRGSGGVSQTDALPVRLLEAALVSPRALRYSDTTANLTANATFTGTSRDAGATPLYSEFRALAYADQGGTLLLEQSPDGTAWYTVVTQPVASGDTEIAQMPLVCRYARARYVNGGVNQTAFRLESAMLGAG